MQGHVSPRALVQSGYEPYVGADGIANYFPKIGLPVIAESLCDTFSLSIATGVFPDS